METPVNLIAASVSLKIVRVRRCLSGDMDGFTASAHNILPGSNANSCQECCSKSSSFGCVNAYQFASHHVSQNLAPQCALRPTPKARILLILSKPVLQIRLKLPFKPKATPSITSQKSLFHFQGEFYQNQQWTLRVCH